MSVLYIDDEYVNIDTEVGTKEWERQIYENDLSERELEEFINIINNV